MNLHSIPKELPELTEEQLLMMHGIYNCASCPIGAHNTFRVTPTKDIYYLFDEGWSRVDRSNLRVGRRWIDDGRPLDVNKFTITYGELNA